MSVLQQLNNVGIVPVVVLDSAESALPLARALLAGGINVMEITCRSNAAYDSIKSVSNNCPEMIVGAGTIINSEQCMSVIAAGAKFIVSPGLNKDIVKCAQELSVDVIPGAVTPTEIMQALNLGLKTVKFFPAETFGGVTAIKSLAAPFANVSFMPTGGINESNLQNYLSCKNIIAVGGSWICDKKLLAKTDFSTITSLAQKAVNECSKFRSI